MSKHVQPRSYESRVDYIDPARSRSSVGFNVGHTTFGRFDAEVELASCDRKIVWDFGGNAELEYRASIAKINRAIDALQRFRRALVEGRAEWKRRRRKKRR